MSNDKQTGVCVVGTLKGKFEKPQRNNSNYVDLFLAIVTGSYMNEFGETMENVEKVSLTPDQHAEVSDALVGRPVRVWVGQKVQYGLSKATKAPYGFLRIWMLKGTMPEPVTGK